MKRKTLITRLTFLIATFSVILFVTNTNSRNHKPHANSTVTMQTGDLNPKQVHIEWDKVFGADGYEISVYSSIEEMQPLFEFYCDSNMPTEAYLVMSSHGTTEYYHFVIRAVKTNSEGKTEIIAIMQGKFTI